MAVAASVAGPPSLSCLKLASRLVSLRDQACGRGLIVLLHARARHVQVSVGCGLLEEALHLLQPLTPGRDFIAPELAREIKLGLAELQSHVALEQVWRSFGLRRGVRGGGLRQGSYLGVMSAVRCRRPRQP